jgi:hypothetical protein
MFGLIRLVFSLFIFAVVVWFATMVPLGSRTLWQHVRAIAGTKEAKELAEGTKEEARKVADKLRDDHDLGARHGRPLDDPGVADRKRLDELTRPPAPAKKPGR